MAAVLWLPARLAFVALNVLLGVLMVMTSSDFCGSVFETKVGHALVGHVMSTADVADEFECQQKCLRNNSCKSFNVHPGADNAKRICELNNKTRKMKPSDFKKKKGSTYYGSVKISCVDVSRGNKQTNSGRCHPGYEGKQCQKPKTCSEIKSQSPQATNGSYVIDPDGEGGYEPFTVFCDMTNKNEVGVTVVGHNSEDRTLVEGYEAKGSYVRNVDYIGAGLSSVAQLADLADSSASCEQFIKYECHHTVLFKVDNSSYGWWVSRDMANMTYWGGATSTDSYKCACGVTSPNTCADTARGCNCDINDATWREDSGLLTEKSYLPVKQLRFGDTGEDKEKGYYTLGKLKCYGMSR